MIVEKYEIPQEDVDALMAWMEGKGTFTTKELEVQAVARANLSGDGKLLSRTGRLADRLVTLLKKRGTIKNTKKTGAASWRWVSSRRS